MQTPGKRRAFSAVASAAIVAGGVVALVAGPHKGRLAKVSALHQDKFCATLRSFGVEARVATEQVSLRKGIAIYFFGHDGVEDVLPCVDISCAYARYFFESTNIAQDTWQIDIGVMFESIRHA